MNAPPESNKNEKAAQNPNRRDDSDDLCNSCCQKVVRKTEIHRSLLTCIYFKSARTSWADSSPYSVTKGNK